MKRCTKYQHPVPETGWSINNCFRFVRFIVTGISVVMFCIVSCAGSQDAGIPAHILRSGNVRMVLIPGGTFRMGSTGGRDDELPVHDVQVSPFYMDEVPVTYREFDEYVRAGGTPPAYWNHRSYSSYHKPDNPVSGVSWYEAVLYCNWRSRRDGLQAVYSPSGKFDAWGYEIWNADVTRNGYRLPTEAEWEYAARGGLDGKKYPWGNEFNAAWANFDEGKGSMKGHWWRLSPVKEQKRNACGLYGMAGNVWEWTGDWYAPRYRGSWFSLKDPEGPRSGRRRVIRGGSWGSPSPDFLRVSRRSSASPDLYLYDIGFRMVRSATGSIQPGENQNVPSSPCSVRYRAPEPVDPFDFGPLFRKRLAGYIGDRFNNCLYFHETVDRQEVLTPERMADLIVRIAVEEKVHPLFLTGIMKGESGFGSVSFPRWFNSPMAFHWGNSRMRFGPPRYRPRGRVNRKFHDLEEGFRAFCRGIRRGVYYRAARRDLYAFHIVYVGSEAPEWMRSVAQVYRDVTGAGISARKPAYNFGRYVYLDWRR
ncbi:MAG TPA: formylglycine-generating enzyme family protein [Spirochaetota bacterium]|nr:formylglycine-generating enzyme family protein [Spirochaetota bacterium]